MWHTLILMWPALAGVVGLGALAIGAVLFDRWVEGRSR